MRKFFLALAIALSFVPAAQSQVSVSIGFNMPVYPQLVRVPGYPVYYAPNSGANYFFYDGLYWVFANDNWYESRWYNGPWRLVGPEFVPLFILRVPVRYYARPPVYFRGWAPGAALRWGVLWGCVWEYRHRDWFWWVHRSVPAAAPLPIYQREYRGDRYPHSVEQQRNIRDDRYRYQPRDSVAREQFHNAPPMRERPQLAQPEPRVQHAPQFQPQPQAEPQHMQRVQPEQRARAPEQREQRMEQRVEQREQREHRREGRREAREERQEGRR